jgi:hypothetical protein
MPWFKPMLARHIPRWALPAALGGVLAIVAADAVLMQRHPVSVRPPAVPETIGLRADAEGERLRVQWNRASRQIRNADHAVLFIEDGTVETKLDLTGRQLDSASVLYWPESERVTFRLEVYRGAQSSSDSTEVAPAPARGRRKPAGLARALVEQTRPSAFQQEEPATGETQTLPAPVVAHRQTPEPPPPEPEAVPLPAAAGPPRESRVSRMISKIPLLRRLRKHPPPDGTEPR